MINLETLATEQRNSHSQHIDSVSTEDMLRIINDEDHKVADAVGAIIPDIAKAVDTISDRLRHGGRLFYMGSGTSGRLGILDAVECPPTYSTDPERIQGLIAGGYEAIFRAKEGAEDSPELGRQDLIAKNLTADDVVVGLSASGRTPLRRRRAGSRHRIDAHESGHGPEDDCQHAVHRRHDPPGQSLWQPHGRRQVV